MTPAIITELHDMSLLDTVNELSIDETLHRKPAFANQSFDAVLFL
jgi:hypothetical protein